MPTAPHRRYADFLGEDERASLLAWTIANERRFRPSALVGRKMDPAVRRSHSLRDMGPAARAIVARIGELTPELIAAFGLTGFAAGDIELELVAHGDGDRFERHIDTVTGAAATGRARVLSCVYYFFREPKTFTGGALRLYGFGESDAGGFVDIEPAQNSFVVFPSFVQHEVRPVASPTRDFAASRFAVNAWIHRAAP
jgi:Rps23 Pro-64 3,4-dihydroxylase Tpa1-like proline 4-hydroxylase